MSNKKNLLNIWLALALALLSGEAMADANSDAFTDGKDFGNTQSSAIKPTITPANASANVPGYAATSGESALFSDGNGVLTPAANSDVNHCNSTTSAMDPNAAANGHCEGVRMITANPNAKASLFPIDKNTDPLVVQGKTIKSNPSVYTNGSFGGGAYSGCTTSNVSTGAVYQEEHCTESLAVEVTKCKHTYTANVGYLVKGNAFNVDQGSNVAPWSAQTFNFNLVIDGTPETAILNHYQIDNYGQLWINDVKVYENVLPGYTDMRNGSVANAASGLVYKDNTGSVLGGFYDDGCNWGCRGVNPGLNITPYLQEGNNKIELVCANAKKIGPCTVSITGTSKKLANLGTVEDNQCASYEGRAK